jgi:hypothetical protein
LNRGDYHAVDGEYTTLDDFVADFHGWLRAKGKDVAAWPRERVRREMAAHLPTGPGPQNKTVIGNLTKDRTRPRRFVRTDEGKVRLD